MQSVSELELESLGIRRGGKRPWGWFFAGLIAVGSAGFALAYYVPLRGAHSTLVGEHETLGRKAKELDHALVTTTAKLKTTEEQRATLQAAKDKEASAAAAVRQKLEVTAATIANTLAVPIKYRRLAIETAPSQLTLRIGKRWVYLPASARVSGSGQQLLCSAMRPLAQESSLMVTASVPVAPDAPIKDWSLAGEQAASLAAILLQGCGAKGKDVRAETRVGQDGVGDEVRLIVTSATAH